MTLIDEKTKAELFTFLVVGHLLALVRSGDFLRTSLLQPATWGAASQRWSNSRLKRGMAIPKTVSYILRRRS